MTGSRPNFLLMATGSLLLCGTGCLLPQVTIIQSEAQRMEENGRLKALAFLTGFEAQGLANEQLMCEVRLFGRGYRPIRSVDGRYQLADGQVGAARSVMVFRSPQTIRDVRITIPSNELHLQAEHMPAVAEIGIYRVNGECLARQGSQVPIGDAADVKPPLETPEADRGSHWFVKGIGRWSTLLFGPYDTEEEAFQHVNSPSDVPREIESSAYIWIVPLTEKADPDAVEWVGPCETEEDVQQLLDVLNALVEEGGGMHDVGPPMKVRMATWLERRQSAAAPVGP